MKRRWMWAAAAVFSAGLAVWAADPVAQVGISANEAQQQLMAAVTAGNLPYGTVMNAFKKLPPAARATLTQDAATWAKGITASAAFRTAYTNYRNSAKPQVPTFTGTVDEEFKRQQAERDKQMADTRRNLASLPPEQRTAIEAAMKQSEQTMNTPEMQKMMRDGIAMQRTGQQQDYQRQLKEWQDAYPETPNPLIAKRLRHFLDATAGVDFSAQLVSRNGKMVFANPQYESKPGEWKMYYRVGRESVTAGRTVATAWLKELEGK